MVALAILVLARPGKTLKLGLTIRTKSVGQTPTSPRHPKSAILRVASAVPPPVAYIPEESSTDTKQGLSGSTFNMVKAAIGSGVLALPAGVAAMGDTKTALVPAVSMMTILGLLSAYSFYSIGRLCGETKAESLTEVWEKVIGHKTAWLVTMACFITPLGAALTYSINLGAFFSSLAKTAGFSGIMAQRQTSIALITLFALYPLCLMRSLAALAPVSVVGVAAILMTAGFMGLRCVDGTYSASGYLLGTLDKSLQPLFGQQSLRIWAPTSLILVSMAATAYQIHFVAPDFYRDLKNNTKERFKFLSFAGFGVTVLLSTLMMALGFLTFGGNCSGMILNNYSNLDFGAAICRLLMAISLVGSYPFCFASMKNSFLQMTAKGKEITVDANKKVTRLLLGGITAVALVLENVGFVVGLNGAVMGSAIIYIFPSLLYLRSAKKQLADGVLIDSARHKVERAFNRFLIVFGVLCGLIGGGVTIADAFFPHLLR